MRCYKRRKETWTEKSFEMAFIVGGVCLFSCGGLAHLLTYQVSGETFIA